MRSKPVSGISIDRLNSGNFRIFELIAKNVELKKSFKMIPNTNQFPGNSRWKFNFLTFAWALG